jgi:hypothetical protein
MANLFTHFDGALPRLFTEMKVNDVSFVLVRVLHKDEKILGRKNIYLPHAQTAICDSKVKLFLKQGISHPVPDTFTRLRSCIVPTEITEPPKISGGQNHKYDGR